MGRYRIEQHQGPPRGDLYELEIKHRFDVIDERTGRIVLSFEGEMNASFDGGLWQHHQVYGTERVELADDGRHVLVYESGREEPRRVEIPRPES